MHDAVDTATPSAEPDYITACFGAAVESVPAPALVCSVVAAVAALSGANPEAVAAVALATLATCIGPKMTVRQGRTRFPVGFNVIVSHQAPRSLPWFDAVTGPLIGRVFEMQAALNAPTPRDGIAEQLKELQSGTILPDPKVLAALEAKRVSALKPFTATSDVAPRELGRLMPQSFDNGLVIIAAGTDPGADLLRLKTTERAALAELLNRSWTGTPLCFGHEVYQGQVSLLWQTRRGIKELVGDRGIPAPVLFIEDAAGGKPLPEYEHESEWQDLITSLYNHRCLGLDSVLTFSPEAEAELTGFDEDIGQDSVPAALRAYISWLPELASRLAALIWILADHDSAVIDAAAAIDAISLTKWLGRQHVSTVAAAMMTDGAASADHKTRLLTKIRARGPILRRDLRRTFSDQRVRWFDDALDGLIEEKIVRYNDTGMLIPASG